MQFDKKRSARKTTPSIILITISCSNKWRENDVGAVISTSLRNIPALSSTPTTILERCLPEFNLPRARRLAARRGVAILLSLSRRDAMQRHPSRPLNKSKRISFVSLKRAMRHRRRRGVSLPLRTASLRKRAGSPSLSASRSFPRSLVLSLSLSPSLSRRRSLASPFAAHRGERNLQHCNPGHGTKIHSREDSGRQRRSRTFTVGLSTLTRFRASRLSPRWRDEKAARIGERGEEREREEKDAKALRQQDRHERRIDGSCAAPSCRLEKSHVFKITETRARLCARRGIKNIANFSSREARRAAVTTNRRATRNLTRGCRRIRTLQKNLARSTKRERERKGGARRDANNVSVLPAISGRSRREEAWSADPAPRIEPTPSRPRVSCKRDGGRQAGHAAVDLFKSDARSGGRLPRPLNNS